MRFVSVVSTLLLAAQAFALKYTDCGSQTGKIIEVRVTGCADSAVCELKRGETYTYGLTFESLTDSTKLRAVLHGIVSGVSYPYPLPNSNVCETHDVECPVTNGGRYDFEQTFEVARNFPTMRVDVKWELKDDNDENVVCGIVPMKIV